MSSHRFKVGDTVRIVKSANINLVESFLNQLSVIRTHQTGETWEVIKLLPADNSDFQYHIRGSQMGLARLVRETELALA